MFTFEKVPQTLKFKLFRYCLFLSLFSLFVDHFKALLFFFLAFSLTFLQSVNVRLQQMKVFRMNFCLFLFLFCGHHATDSLNWDDPLCQIEMYIKILLSLYYRSIASICSSTLSPNCCLFPQVNEVLDSIPAVTGWEAGRPPGQGASHLEGLFNFYWLRCANMCCMSWSTTNHLQTYSHLVPCIWQSLFTSCNRHLCCKIK